MLAGAAALVALGWRLGLGRRIDLHAIRAVHVVWGWLALAAVVNLVSILAKGAVWKAALEPVRAVGRVSWRAVVSAMFVGFLVNTVLAARVGEVARVAVLKRRLRLEGLDVRFATLAGTVVAEQIVLGIALIVLVGALALIVPLPGWVAWGLAVVAVALVLAGLALAIAAWSSRRKAAGAGAAAGRIARLLAALVAGHAVFGRPRLAAVALGRASSPGSPRCSRSRSRSTRSASTGASPRRRSCSWR